MLRTTNTDIMLCFCVVFTLIHIVTKRTLDPRVKALFRNRTSVVTRLWSRNPGAKCTHRSCLCSTHIWGLRIWVSSVTRCLLWVLLQKAHLWVCWCSQMFLEVFYTFKFTALEQLPARRKSSLIYWHIYLKYYHNEINCKY